MAKQYGNRWQVVDSIAESGQAHVFRVVDSTGELEGEFALKRLRNPARKERFESELRALETVTGAAVVKPVDVQLDDPAFYVTRYYSAGSLRKQNLASWSLERKFDFFYRYLIALHACHQQGVVHRDIKPDNILVDEDGGPLIIDFGLCYIDGEERVTLSEEQLGSKNYIAPELEKGRYDEVDERLNVYSSGKVLYWMLAGIDLPREAFLEERFRLSERTGDSRLGAIELLFLKSITENPSDRVRTGQLLSGSRRVFDALLEGGNIPSAHVDQPCMYCRMGKYITTGAVSNDGSSRELANAGMTNYSGKPVRLMHCDQCGHFQMFTTQRPFNTRWVKGDNTMMWLFSD